MKTELCIMPPNDRYYTTRLNGTCRHEIYFGQRNREKSIKYGLVVFIKPTQHNVGLYGVHCKYGHEFDTYLKELGQKVFMEYYNKTVEDFISEFGRSMYDARNY